MSTKSKFILILALCLIILIAIVSGFILYSKNKILSPSELQAQRPTAKSSLKELKAYAAVLEKQQVHTNKIALNGCHPNPVVAQIKIGDTVTFTNMTSKMLSIQGQSGGFNIGPHKYLQLVLRQQGVYFYGCDRSQKPVGIVVTTQ